MSEPHPAKVTKAWSSGPSFANVQFHIGPDGISAPELSADENVGAELATWAEQLLWSIDSQTIRDRGLRGTLSIDVTLEAGALGLTPAAERWLAWRVLDSLGASQGLQKPRQPKAAIAVRWIPAGDVSQNLTTPSKKWQKGPVRGRAKDEADGAFPKKPKRERSLRLQKAARAFRDLDEVARTLTDDDIQEFAEELRQAQRNPPRDKAAFVRDKNRYLDEFNWRILVNGKPVGRLRVSHGYSIQVSAPGNRGTNAFGSAPDVQIERIPD